MTRTLHRAPASERTHHTLDFLHGIDLERVHLRRPRGPVRGIVLGALLLLASLAALVLLITVVRPPSPVAELQLSGHDSGIAQAVAVREAARDVTAHDSGIAQALAVRAPVGEVTAHDSGIAQALSVREAARQVTPHDSGIELALRSP